MKRFLNIYSNPTMFFGVLALILALVLLIKNGFHSPDLYTIDREALNNFAYLTKNNDMLFSYIESGVINPDYEILCMLYKVFAFIVGFLVFSAVMKIKTWKSFLNLPLISNKPFIIVWLNVITFIFLCVHMQADYLISESFLRPWHDNSAGFDTMFILFIGMFFMMIYYPLINLALFFVYKKNLKNIFFLFIFYLFLFYLLKDAVMMNFINYFSWLYLFLDIYYIFTAYILFSIIKFMTKN